MSHNSHRYCADCSIILTRLPRLRIPTPNAQDIGLKAHEVQIATPGLQHTDLQVAASHASVLDILDAFFEQLSRDLY